MATPTRPPCATDDSTDILTLIDREGLTLSEAADLIPSRKKGKRVDVNTLWRWCRKGMISGLRLRSVLIGNVRYTTRTWLADFIRDKSSATLTKDGHTAEPPRSPATRSSASSRAEEELRKRWQA